MIGMSHWDFSVGDHVPVDLRIGTRRSAVELWQLDSAALGLIWCRIFKSQISSLLIITFPSLPPSFEPHLLVLHLGILGSSWSAIARVERPVRAFCRHSYPLPDNDRLVKRG